MQIARGFTLLELIITLVISTLLIAIAIPSFTTLIQNNRLTAASSSIQSDILFARNQSVSYLNYVTVCPLDLKDDGTCDSSCTCTSDWINGLDIFIDNGIRGELDSNDVLLKQGAVFNGNDNAIYPNNFITFTPDGQITGNAEIFRYCTDNDKLGISIAYSGLATIIDSDNVADCSNTP